MQEWATAVSDQISGESRCSGKSWRSGPDGSMQIEDCEAISRLFHRA